MLSFIRRLSLRAKFLIFTTGVLVIIFAVLAVVIYRSQKNDIIANSDRRMYSQLEDLTNLLEIEYKYKQSSIENALKVAANVISNRGEISATEATTVLAIINQKTESKKIVEVPQWLIAGQMVQKNNALVDTIQKLTGSQTSIFQKIPDGYVRISTTEEAADGAKSLLGYYLSNNDPIVQTIARGKKFEGRLNIDNEWYITAYQPIRINGEIAGMLYTGAKEKDLGYLRKKFKEKKYYNTGYPFAMTPEGEYIIHPILEGKDNQDPEFTAFVKKNKRGKYRYKYPDNKDGAWKLTYFTYYEPYDLIIGATLDENQILDRTLVGVKNTLILGFLVALLLCLLGIALIVNWITSVINKLVVILSGMAAGRKMEPVQIKSEDEIGVMASSVNTLIDGFDAYANFAEQIGQGNLNATFKSLSESDILGNALIEMKESLKQVAQEDNKRTWMSEGLALFSDILRKYNDDIQKLSYEIIANLVGYINANQGGIFILNEEDPQHRHLEMLACYAYDKHKMMKKQVNVGEGLLGQSFKEQDTLNIREVPDNYVNIVSGLGEANPNNILIVPLTSNDITIGVVELVAFEAFSERDIEFVEKVSESITITISSVKSNLQTKALLEESQELTEQMRAQEEEMRQNVEELQATQEEMQRNTKEMRRILQEEQKKQALLTSVIDSPKDMVVALDEDYKILSFNEAAQAWYYKTNGVKLSVGVNILPMLTLQQREAYKDKFKQAIEGEIVQYEEEVLQEEAPSDFYEHRYYPLKNDQGSILGLSIVTREVSTRKHKEKELLKSNQHLQESEETLQTTLQKVKEERNTVQQKQQFTEQQLQAINESTLGRIDIDLDSTILYTNSMFCNIMSYSKEELEGNSYKMMVKESEQNSVNYIEFWRNLRSGTVQAGVYKRKNKFGEDVWLNAVFMPLKDENGKVHRIMKVCFDETVRVLKEKTYKDKIEQLQKEIDQLRK